MNEANATANASSCSDLPRDYQKIVGVAGYLIYRSRSLHATRLQKLYYLAELKSIEKHGRRLTSADYCNWDYGPFSADLAKAVDGIGPKAFAMSRMNLPRGPAKIYRPTAKDVQHGLNKEDRDVLDEVLREWGARSTDAIIKAAKTTEPFIWSSYGDPIDFDEYIHWCNKLYHNPTVKKKFEDNSRAAGKVYSNVKDLIKAI
jgi:uncharacterized phage-associated protein